MFDGRSYTADEQGMVRVPGTRPQPATHRLSLVDATIHQPRRDLTFVRWWFPRDHDQDHRMAITGITVRRHVRIEAAFRATYMVRYSFVDPAQGPVDHERMSGWSSAATTARRWPATGAGRSARRYRRPR